MPVVGFIVYAVLQLEWGLVGPRLACVALTTVVLVEYQRFELPNVISNTIAVCTKDGNWVHRAVAKSTHAMEADSKDRRQCTVHHDGPSMRGGRRSCSDLQVAAGRVGGVGHVQV